MFPLVSCIRRESWAVLLVFLHLFVAPCATAMVLMPADMDCEHCQTISSPDDCAVASALTSSVIGGLAFDSGRADRPPQTVPFSTPLVRELVPSASQAMVFAQLSPLTTSHHSGDPPLYLLLSQLRI